jgi:plastocyanin
VRCWTDERGAVLLALGAALVWLSACSPPDAHGRTVVEVTDRGVLSPASVVVETGDDVTWWNHDAISHRVVVDGMGIDRLVMSGDVLVVTFDRVGTYVVRDPGSAGLLGVIDVSEVDGVP